MKRIILGVSGGAYASEALKLARKLAENGYAVDVVLTPAGAAAVPAREFEAATGRQVCAPDSGGAFDEGAGLALAEGASLALLAPATAAAIAKLAAGLADDPLTAALLALDGVPVLLCPAMDEATYRNPITQRNRRELENLGYYFVGPRSTERGRGALAEEERILEQVGDMLDPECWGAYI